MTAPTPSPAEAATIARFGIFEAEERVEQVARAMQAADPDTRGVAWEGCDGFEHRKYRRLAAAAIAAIREGGRHIASGQPLTTLDDALAAAVTSEGERE